MAEILAILRFHALSTPFSRFESRTNPALAVRLATLIQIYVVFKAVFTVTGIRNKNKSYAVER